MGRIRRLEEYEVSGASAMRAFRDLYGKMAELSDGMQKKYYSEMLADARKVKVTRLSEALDEDEIKRIAETAEPKPHQCYANSMKTALVKLLGRNFKYCEGFMMIGGFPVEHAFNSVNGVYVDVTADLALGGLKEGTEYILVGEWTPDKALDAMEANGVYGGVYREMFVRSHREL